MWGEIAENCELVVAFGGLALKNSQINPGGLARHQTQNLQRRCREAGVRFVNISPIRSDTAGFLDAEWLPVVPNTDTAAMLGIAHTMLVNGWHDEDFLRRCCVGFDRFASYLVGELDGIPKDAAWAAKITGIGRDAITDLAGRLTTQRSLIMVNYAVQRADHGEQPIWMSVVLAAMAGSMGRPGCGWGAGYATMDATGVAPDRPFVGTIPSVPNPVPDFIPVARIADALLHPGTTIDYDGRRLTLPDLRLVYWCGGTLSTTTRISIGWRAPGRPLTRWWFTKPGGTPRPSSPTSCCPSPPAWSATTSRPDSRPHIVAMPKVREPAGESRTDHHIFAALASRLGYEREFTESRSEIEWVRHLYEQTKDRLGGNAALPSFDDFWRGSTAELPAATGPFPGGFADLRSDPQRFPLLTPSGRIEIFSEEIDSFGYDDCAGHPKWFEPVEWLRADLVGPVPAPPDLESAGLTLAQSVRQRWPQSQFEDRWS